MFVWDPLSRRNPGTFGNPDMVELSGLRNREDALRDAAAKAFIDNPKIEGHGDRRCFIRTRIVKFSIHHNGDGSEASFLASGRKLDQSQSTRPLVDRRLVPVVRQNLGFKPRTGKPGICQPNHGGEGDG